MQKNLIQLFAVTIISFGMTSCGEEQQVVADYEETTDTLTAEVTTNMNLIRVSIPAPTVIAGAMSSAGLNFNKSLLNSAGKSGSYSTKYQAAVNLGIYGADIGYLASYNQTQDFLTYVKEIGKLAKVVGVEQAFDEEFASNITDAFGKGDTLKEMINQAYLKAERNLRSNERVATSALIIAGGWIEGLYLAAEAASEKATDEASKTGLYHEVFNQVFAFQYVLDLLTQYENDPDCKKMLEELEPAKSVLLKMSRVNKMNISHIQQIKEVVSPLRSKLV